MFLFLAVCRVLCCVAVCACVRGVLYDMFSCFRLIMYGLPLSKYYMFNQQIPHTTRAPPHTHIYISHLSIAQPRSSARSHRAELRPPPPAGRLAWVQRAGVPLSWRPLRRNGSTDARSIDAHASHTIPS